MRTSRIDHTIKERIGIAVRKSAILLSESRAQHNTSNIAISWSASANTVTSVIRTLLYAIKLTSRHSFIECFYASVPETSRLPATSLVPKQSSLTKLVE